MSTKQPKKDTGRLTNGKSSPLASAEDRFNDAHQRLQLSVKEHLEKASYESSSEEEDLESEPIFESVVKTYSQLGGNAQDLVRTQHFLSNTFQSGAAICPICIATIKRIDLIWNCIHCYGYFHLHCIQKWAKDSIALTKLHHEDHIKKDLNILWQCPNCRKDYLPKQIPQKYLCFCGQQEDPEFQTWLVPHSCGNVCHKQLTPDCGHECLLLCHPGPCPPCPKTVTESCFCGHGGRRLVRCNHRGWSCSKICGKQLSCGDHTCSNQCHDGPCAECPRTSVLACRCGNEKLPIPCGVKSWQCDKVCGALLSCGLHQCQEKCHEPGSCGACPTLRPCPCGKTVADIPCNQPVRTCTSTCDKPLDCQKHLCPQKCHQGPCGKCFVVLEKKCRCGLNTKELPCQKEYLCNTKCTRKRDCGIHQCTRKCCGDQCPPCEKVCDKMLPCRQHRCSSICHRGPCYPCRLTIKISCRCHSTVCVVPCGSDPHRRPKCEKPCRLPPDCYHPERSPHPCHFGACPPCRQKCDKALPCSHKCPKPCHSTQLIYQPGYKPATPWEAACMPMQKVQECPPCQEPVEVTCFGGHETILKPCCEANVTTCGKPCGRPLLCTNHTCSLMCHPLSEECETCDRKCEKERECEHECYLECHPGPCTPCLSLKLACHCKLIHVYVACKEWVTAASEERDRLLSCGNQCPGTYSCGHRCTKICHSGPCGDGEACRKKVKINCPCKRQKKEVKCFTVSSGVNTLSCDDICRDGLRKKNEAVSEKMTTKEEELRNKKELEMYEKRLLGKRRNRRHTSQTSNEPQKSFFSSRFFIGFTIAFTAIAIAMVFFNYN